MEPLYFSFIIPVFNRPEEIDQLLESMVKLEGVKQFEVVIVEDGSSLDSRAIVQSYMDKLNVSYYFKANSGPGSSRNYGMRRAKGNYFIILDSDCLLPANYLKTVQDNLKAEFVDCFGGPDTAHGSFSNLQKAINFAMTSAITTGGIRGGRAGKKTFQPRSFNMGISKNAFEASGGFGNIHPGEDPDLAIRIKKMGFKTKLFPQAFVYHKRRISWHKFLLQVYKFGLVRPILNHWHPSTSRFAYWFPSLFTIGLLSSLVLLCFGCVWPIGLYLLYFFVVFMMALFSTKNILVAMQSVVAIFLQFLGYGYGFLKSALLLFLSKKTPQNQFPNLFFDHGEQY